MTAYHSASHTRAGEQCDTRARFDAIDLARKDEEAIVGLKVTLMDVDGRLTTARRLRPNRAGVGVDPERVEM